MSGAGKRLARQAVDWAKFAEFIPAEQRSAFQAFRVHSEQYVKSVGGKPESLPKIDFAAYKSKAPALAAVIDQFEKQYASLNVPYPTDKSNQVAQIDTDKLKAKTDFESYKKASDERVEENQLRLSKWDYIPPFEHMTMEEFTIYFPEGNPMHKHDPYKPPTFWPHTPETNTPEIHARFKDYKMPVTDPYADH